MKIYVCIKQIPDPNTVVSKLDPGTKRLVRSGVSLVLDPGDETNSVAASFHQLNRNAKKPERF